MRVACTSPGNRRWRCGRRLCLHCRSRHAQDSIPAPGVARCGNNWGTRMRHTDGGVVLGFARAKRGGCGRGKAALTSRRLGDAVALRRATVRHHCARLCLITSLGLVYPCCLRACLCVRPAHLPLRASKASKNRRHARKCSESLLPHRQHLSQHAQRSPWT